MERIRKLQHRRGSASQEVSTPHATLSTAPPNLLGDLPADRYGSGDEDDDKDEEAAELAAELDETMSRAGSEWSHLAWWGDNRSETDLRDHDIRKVGGFSIARPRVRVLVEHAKYSARENRAKASAFVDRRKQKMSAARDEAKERREHALAVIQRAAREKKRKMASGAAAVRGKAAAKVLGARDKAVGAPKSVPVAVGGDEGDKPVAAEGDQHRRGAATAQREDALLARDDADHKKVSRLPLVGHRRGHRRTPSSDATVTSPPSVTEMLESPQKDAAATRREVALRVLRKNLAQPVGAWKERREERRERRGDRSARSDKEPRSARGEKEPRSARADKDKEPKESRPSRGFVHKPDFGRARRERKQQQTQAAIARGGAASVGPISTLGVPGSAPADALGGGDSPWRAVDAPSWREVGGDAEDMDSEDSYHSAHEEKDHEDEDSYATAFSSPPSSRAIVGEHDQVVDVGDPNVYVLANSLNSLNELAATSAPAATSAHATTAAADATAAHADSAGSTATAAASPAVGMLVDDTADATAASAPPPTSSVNVLPRERWSEPTDTLIVRGPTYIDDGKKVDAAPALCSLFACQCFELGAEHLAGASAKMLHDGTLVPPPTSKFVLTINFMCPKPNRTGNATSLMAHSASDDHPTDVAGPEGHLLRELWRGDATTAISRCKVLAGLRSGPALVRHTMSWMGLDETRPMLMCRQLHASINRATIAHRGGGGATFEHIEIALDAAASPLCNQMYKYAWPSLPSVIVDITLMLEARAAEHLPERPLARFTIDSLKHEEISGQPSDWPTEEGQIPGECLGSYRTNRGAGELGSWQATREVITKGKPAKKGFFG